VKTKLANLSRLKETLSSLSINWHKNDLVRVFEGQAPKAEIVIKQSKYDIGFRSTNNNYEFVSDLMFWEQPCSIEKFLNQIQQRYAYEGVVVSQEGIGYTHYNSIRTKSEQVGSISFESTRYI
jgi:hypothetical protein